MTVATRDLGDRDFDYPEIELTNYHKGFGKPKVIGDDENPSNEGRTVTPAEAPAVENNSEEPASAPTASTKEVSPTVETKQAAPKPQSAPVPQKQQARLHRFQWLYLKE